MRFTILLALLALPALAAAQSGDGKPTATDNNCIRCHSRLMKNYALPAQRYHDDIHADNGVLCSDCHGGNPANPNRHDRKDPAQHFRGKPTPQEIPGLCGHCHSDPAYMRAHNPKLPVDQLEKYRTSRHGELLLGKGDPKPAQCVSCHSVHDIRQVNNPASKVYPTNVPGTCAACHADEKYMADYGIPTNQYALYRGSVHGAALLDREDTGAPACNDCHGNHGAYPPEVQNVAQVCGLCHIRNAKLYEASFHSSIFESIGESGCVTCHANHGIRPPVDAMLGAGDRATCGKCHRDGQSDPGFALGLEMKGVLDGLSQQLDSAGALVDQAAKYGMEVSELQFDLRDIRQSLIESRTTIHSFDPDEVRKSAAPGLALAAKVDTLAWQSLAEHGKRRWWLGGATLVLLSVIAGVIMLLRQVERK